MPMKPPLGGPPSARSSWSPSAPRLRGRRLQALRVQLLALQPYCASCGRILSPSSFVRDHIVPLAEGGQDITANTQALCLACSEAKSQAEAARGRTRTRP